MKFQMAENSLFAILLRSHWAISVALGLAVLALAMAMLPAQYRIIGAVSAAPCFVIAVMAARRQWQIPGTAELERTREHLQAMAWPEFCGLLEQGFTREGYTVSRINGVEGTDLRLEREGRATVVGARRWKSASIGVDQLRPLAAALESDDVQYARLIGLGELTDSARSFATKHRIEVWSLSQLAQSLRTELRSKAR